MASDRLYSYLSFLALLMSKYKFLKSAKNLSTSRVSFSSTHSDTDLRKDGGRAEGREEGRKGKGGKGVKGEGGKGRKGKGRKGEGGRKGKGGRREGREDP